MKIARVLPAVLALLAAAAPLSAAPEAMRLAAEEAFSAVSALPRLAAPFQAKRKLPAPPRFEKPVVNDPSLKPLDPSRSQGRPIGKVALPELLDKHRDLLVRQLGSLAWGISAAGDAAFKSVFLTFAREATLVIAPVGDLDRLRGDGVTVTVAPGVVYNVKVQANIFDPVRGSTLKITAVQGTKGPSHQVKTGAVLDAVKAKAFVFRAGGKEFWLLHGTDVDPATNTLAQTKSLLFIHMNGLSSKAWPVAEAALAVDQPYSAALGETKIVLVKDAAGLLSISEP